MINKTTTLLLLAVLLVCTAASGQTFRKADKSPMDMAYFPDNFAHDRKDGDQAVIRVTYSRPAKNGREVFGKLVPFAKVWRTGANESPEIKFYQDVVLGGKTVTAGTYSLFTIPEQKEWTIILNTDIDYWGAFKYNADHDVLRVTAKVGTVPVPVENFTIQFESTGSRSGVMRIAWDTTYAEVPFTY